MSITVTRAVDRFLRWSLPLAFAPDCHINFDSDKALSGTWPTGTNLLHAGQARDMVEHMLAVEPGELTDFGGALHALKRGKRVARIGWNGKGMFVYCVPPASYKAQTGAAKAHFGNEAMVPYNAYFAIKNVDESVSTWVPSVNDCLAEDWVVLE
jgi:hypothetical protein